MPFKRFFRRAEEQGDEEIDIEDYLNELNIREGKLIEREDVTYVKPIDLDNEGNGVDEAIRELEKNNIVVLNVKMLLHNKVLLRDVVKKFRELCIDLDGDIGRISNEKILLVPGSMRIIHRGS